MSGSLLSLDALERLVPESLRGELGEATREAAARSLRAWHVPLRAQLGPTACARTLFDRLAVPLFTVLGYHLVPTPSVPASVGGILSVEGQAVAVVLVTEWNQSVSAAWKDVVRLGIGRGLRWSFHLTGPSLRLLDARRTYARRFVEFDLDRTFDDERAFRLFWGLFRGVALRRPSAGAPVLDRAVTLSEAHRAAVRASLQQGVHEALIVLIQAFTHAGGRRKRSAAASRPVECAATFDESLVVIYRVLFLLFAEARGLVPAWHPTYREAYTIEALRGPVELLPRPRGLWETLQAISRLAHRGCRIGALLVSPFNGRLFSPAHAPLADALPLDDGAVRQAVLALTTRPGRAGRERIAYGDLGVEQLGGVYERLLDFEASPTTPGPVLVKAERRKSTGSFYTPRSLTQYLVQRTLAPLAHSATPEQILGLRILDPAMGSGAFLVAACRYLASEYESALLREGRLAPSDISDQDRAGFRRAVAQRCLYGVDLNPMAVQLGRLSLWLATLAAERPLTFLDHRLRTGHSLAGASQDDVARQAPGRLRRRRQGALPLFADPDLDRAVERAVGIRMAIASEPGDTLDQVRDKERSLTRLHGEDSTLTRWRQVVDLWCSAWFADGNEPAVDGRVFEALADRILHDSEELAGRTAEPFLARGRAIAERERFFHWPFEFPEIFYEPDGSRCADPGFDAVIGNPPWETLRGDRGDRDRRSAARTEAARLTSFARESGIYGLQGDGHANMYQLFLERALTLVRRGGRLGLVMPSGLAVDHGAAPLRRALLDRCDIDGLVSVENRDAVFPIHRGLKFLLLTGTTGTPTRTLSCRFGVRRPDTLEEPVERRDTDTHTVQLSRPLLERVSGAQLAIPELRTPRDVQIVSQVAFGFPALGDPDGWHVRFGRELNASDDREHFSETGTGLPVIEGKCIEPFVVHTARARWTVPAARASELLEERRSFGRARLAYRDVASATNRLTLIAAIVPAGSVTTHTLFCLKDMLEEEDQQFLCGMFNSYVANYLVRVRVNTHVSAAIIDRLPMPRPGRCAPARGEIASLSARLSDVPTDGHASARLQALAAFVYGLDRAQFGRVLETFPLVPQPDRDRALSAFCDIVSAA